MHMRRTFYCLISFLLSDCICFPTSTKSREEACKEVLFEANIQNATSKEKMLANNIVLLQSRVRGLEAANNILSYRLNQVEYKFNKMELPIIARVVTEVVETRLDFEDIKLCTKCGGEEHENKSCDEQKVKHPPPSNQKKNELTIYRRAAKWVLSIKESINHRMQILHDNLKTLYKDIQDGKPPPHVVPKFVTYVQKMKDFDEFLWAFGYSVANMHNLINVQVHKEPYDDGDSPKQLEISNVDGYTTDYFLQLLIEDLGNYIDPSKPSTIYKIPNIIPQPQGDS